MTVNTNLGIAQINNAHLPLSQQAQQEIPAEEQPTTDKTTKEEQDVSFFDEEWSGHQISKLTGDNAFTDWLQDKDKVCTDGVNDGKLSFWEGTKSFLKGLIGGIPKMIINHPVESLVTIGAGIALTFITGGAILPVLGAIGTTFGVGMICKGAYGAIMAETDGEAKQAFESMGIGVTTTALSMMSAGKALDAASEAGVESAQISEDANIFQKTAQMFRSTPEALKVSQKNALKFVGIPIQEESIAANSRLLNAPARTEESVHEAILNKEYGALGKNSSKNVKKIFSQYAKEHGYKFEDNEGEFVIKDLHGNKIRTAHQGIFDGRWYDEHYIYNERNQMTNRFVINDKGEFQSTIEFMYDDAGKQTISIGYGGKAGENIVVGKGYSRTEKTLSDFIKEFGYTPKYYNEVVK